MKAAKITVAMALCAGIAVPMTAAAAEAPALDWKLCKDIARYWRPVDDQRTECTMVPVPVDYAKPDGRRITIAVSRVRASDPAARKGIVLLNPGGPGGAGTRMPYQVKDSQSGAIGVDHDLIGFDPRGVDYSANISCPKRPEDSAEPPESWPERAKAEFLYNRDGAANRRCAESDPEFTANLTTDNIARDMDRIRIALGEDKMGFLGISWGTALGASYRTLFDSHVDRMLLDSVMPATFDLTLADDGQTAAGEATFREFSAWISRYDSVYRFGSTQDEVVKGLLKLRKTLNEHPRVIGEGPSKTTIDGTTVTYMMLASRAYWAREAKAMAVLRDGGIPDGFTESAAAARQVTAASSGPVSDTGYDTPPRGLNRFQQTAVLCNEASSSPDFATLWRTRKERNKKYPIAGPSAFWDGHCAQWPWPARQWEFRSGNSPLQLSGHTYESTTPIGWALSMRQRIGGSLLTVQDDVHGSLISLPCAANAVDFFATGKPSTSSCPGAPIPSPELTQRSMDLPVIEHTDPYRTDADRG